MGPKTITTLRGNKEKKIEKLSYKQLVELRNNGCLKKTIPFHIPTLLL
jgi:hypothetical protein